MQQTKRSPKHVFREPPAWLKDLPATAGQLKVLTSLSKRCRIMPKTLADLIDAHQATPAELQLVVEVMRAATAAVPLAQSASG